MKIEGQCQCGAIAYEADIDPKNTSMCHCIDCQTFSGSPYRASVPAKAEDFRLLKGQPKIYIKTAESGNKRAQGFCGNCGTAIYSAAPENPPQYMLRVGAMKQRAELSPQKQIWCSSALPWAQDIGEIPGVPKG